MREDKIKLTKEEWKTLVNYFLSEVAKSATRGKGGAQKAATSLGVSKQRISDMKSRQAFGDKVGWTRMLLYKLEVPDSEAIRILQNPHTVTKKKIGSLSPLEEMFEMLRNLYSENELAGWFKLLISKRKVEKDLKVSLRAVDKSRSKLSQTKSLAKSSRKKKKKKKKKR